MTADLNLDQRFDYEGTSLRRRDLHPDPFIQFQQWLTAAQGTAAQGTALREPHAMTLATADAAGRPSARVVLLRGVDERGFVFYSNYQSRKGQELAHNPRAALLFFWEPLQRQVRVEGMVARVDAAESDAYFASRPRDSQLGAWASAQSTPLRDAAALAAALQAAAARFADRPVPRPPHWGGYRLTPESLEFWQGRPSRLHDRFRYQLVDGAWRIERLAP